MIFASQYINRFGFGGIDPFEDARASNIIQKGS